MFDACISERIALVLNSGSVAAELAHVGVEDDMEADSAEPRPTTSQFLSS